MTSEAKIGLLLGLVFIFVIAFIINGLPDSSRDSAGNELTVNMVDAQPTRLALGQKERSVGKSLALAESAKPASWQEPDNVSQKTGNIRFTMDLPKTTPAAKKLEENLTSAAAEQCVSEAAKVATVAKNSEKGLFPTTYVVQDGDSLACIAQRFYGDEQGNRIININKIFKANRDILNCPDEIGVGQKLTIPPLQNKINKVFPREMFNNIQSIGKRHLEAEGNKVNENKYYDVREGDSLWLIASEQLGNSLQYKEIAKLNAGILHNNDRLTVGMRLRLPLRQ
ncbi:MAG: LysM peptidoglycan-binding domain-containing protein [Sedimentisphaerales bacterium]|nr:LysM peptidoglycan-binding domain-containing protein [Sedimentisphaerales bacterium]